MASPLLESMPSKKAKVAAKARLAATSSKNPAAGKSEARMETGTLIKCSYRNLLFPRSYGDDLALDDGKLVKSFYQDNPTEKAPIKREKFSSSPRFCEYQGA